MLLASPVFECRMIFMNKKVSDKKKNKASISTQLQRVILGLVLAVVVSFLISGYIIIARERRDYSIRESENVVKMLTSNIEAEVERYKELSRLIMTEERLVRFLRADVDSVDISMINDARYGVMDILNVTEGVDTVIVFREDMIMLSTNRFTYSYDYEKMLSDEWRHDIYEGKGKAIISLNTNNIAFKAGDKPMVTIGRAIYDLESQERTGLMLMNISAAIFDKMLSQLRYNDICIMGEDGTFLAGNRNYAGFFDEKDYKTTKLIHRDVNDNGKRILLSGCRIADLPIVIMKATSYGTEGIPVRNIAILMSLLVIFLVLALWTGTFIRRNMTDPIFKLSASMDRNKQSGNLQKIETSMPNSELEMLETDYNDLIDHVNELIETLVEKEKGLQRAEMRVLQEQIKPHFLYNSIETIGFMALEAGADNVHDALETMGRFYRNFLSKGGREIPFSREITIVRDYLSLQKLRYGDIIEDEYDITKEAEDFVVPKLILQPLVENSIYHGIRLKGEKGLIRITGTVADDGLHVIVRDTGVGMSREQIDEILSGDRESKSAKEDKSFGLWGTIERIRIYCDNRDCVDIRSEIGEYTEIEITIPAFGYRNEPKTGEQ